MRVNIKALSVNKCWQGRKFKTQDYKDYEQELLYLLPKNVKTYKQIRLDLEIGTSSKLSDIDNFLKPLIDIFQLKYNFNDNQIYILKVIKTPVKKGQEFIEFKLSKI